MARLSYVGRRLVLAAVTLWGISVLLFSMMHLLPGGPARAILGITATPEQIAAVDAELGLDQPLLTQYLNFLFRLLQGDLGRSMTYGRPVLDVIAGALPTTLALAAYVMVLTTVTTLALATIAALRHGRTADHVIRALPLIGIGMPGFWIGAMLLFLFAVWLPVFPAGGLEPGFVGGLRSLFLPALTMTIAASAVLVRSLRRGLIEVLESDHVMTARAKGLTGFSLIVRHVLPNAAIPTVTLMALVFVSLLSGALIVESVFAIPGIGQLLINAVRRHDIPLVMGISLIAALAVLIVNVVVDVIYTIIDPRVELR